MLLETVHQGDHELIYPEEKSLNEWVFRSLSDWPAPALQRKQQADSGRKV